MESQYSVCYPLKVVVLDRAEIIHRYVNQLYHPLDALQRRFTKKRTTTTTISAYRRQVDRQRNHQFWEGDT